MATFESDELKIKGLIKETIGFTNVNTAVARSMICWIGGIVQDRFQSFVDKDEEAFIDISASECPPDPRGTPWVLAELMHGCSLVEHVAQPAVLTCETSALMPLDAFNLAPPEREAHHSARFFTTPPDSPLSPSRF